MRVYVFVCVCVTEGVLTDRTMIRVFPWQQVSILLGAALCISYTSTSSVVEVLKSSRDEETRHLSACWFIKTKHINVHMNTTTKTSVTYGNRVV